MATTLERDPTVTISAGGKTATTTLSGLKKLSARLGEKNGEPESDEAGEDEAAEESEPETNGELQDEPPPPMTPEALQAARLAAEAAHAEKVAELEKDVADASVEAHRQAEIAKAAKKAAESCVEHLVKVIDNGPDYPPDFKPLPLFDGQQPKPDESWREITVWDLEGITDAVRKKLNEADLDTIGQLADYTASGKALTDVMGAKQAETLEAALDEFWKARS